MPTFAPLKQKSCQAVPPAPAPTVAHAIRRNGAFASIGEPLPGAVFELHAGEPIPKELRNPLERSFGVSLDRVQLHRDARAHGLVQSQQAHAVTLGHHIALGERFASLRSSESRWLLAHEAAHAVQQKRGMSRRVDDANVPALEDEATRAADAAARGERAQIHGEVAPTIQRFPACRHILDATEGTPVREKPVSDFLAARLAATAPTEREFPIPEGSSGTSRDPGTAVSGHTGFADVTTATSGGSVMNILEVKYGSWPLAVDAEAQLEKYVATGGDHLSDLSATWLKRAHPGINLKSVRAMPTTSIDLSTPLNIPQVSVPVEAAWCRDGVVVFKNVGSYGKNTFPCTADTTQIEKFLDTALGTLEIQVDRFIDDLGARLDKKINETSLRDVVKRALQNPTLRQLVEDNIPGGSSILTSANVDLLATVVAQMLRDSEQVIRVLAKTLKDAVMTEVRRLLKERLRAIAREILLSLCALATAVSIERLIDELKRRLPRLVADLIPAAVAAVAYSVLKEIAKAVGMALAAIAAVVVVILCWEAIAAALAAVTLEEMVAAALAALSQLVPRLPIFSP